MEFVHETEKTAKLHTNVSEVLLTELPHRCDAVIKEIERVFLQCKDITTEVQTSLLCNLMESHNYKKEYEAKIELLKQATTKKEQSETSLRKVEDRVSEEKRGKDKKYQAKVKEHEARTKQHQEAIEATTNKQASMILAHAAANASIEHYFTEDLNDIINCFDLGFHQNLRKLAKARMSSMDQIILTWHRQIAAMDL